MEQKESSNTRKRCEGNSKGERRKKEGYVRRKINFWEKGKANVIPQNSETKKKHLELATIQTIHERKAENKNRSGGKSGEKKILKGVESYSQDR